MVGNKYTKYIQWRPKNAIEWLAVGVAAIFGLYGLVIILTILLKVALIAGIGLGVFYGGKYILRRKKANIK